MEYVDIDLKLLLLQSIKEDKENDKWRWRLEWLYKPKTYNNKLICTTFYIDIVDTLSK